VLTSQLASEQVERPIVAKAPSDLGKAQTEPSGPPPVVTPSARTEAPPPAAPSEQTSTDSSRVAGRAEDRAKKIRDLTRRPKDPQPKVASNIVSDRVDDSSAPGDQTQQLYDQGAEQFRKNQFPEAAATLKECVRLDPASARCHRMLGATYARLREPELGAEHYRKFVQLAPDDPDTPKVRIFLEQYDAAKGLSKKD
jgi:tetratricopeptide (TPR) repeat protein